MKVRRILLAVSIVASMALAGTAQAGHCMRQNHKCCTKLCRKDHHKCCAKSGGGEYCSHKKHCCSKACGTEKS